MQLTPIPDVRTQSDLSEHHADSSGIGNDACAADRRWSLLEQARERLLAAFGDDGVTRIEYTAAFPDVDDFGLWLCTDTDQQREALGRAKPLLSTVRSLLVTAGFTVEELEGFSTTVQSQETVDRDYAGSWFNATR